MATYALTGSGVQALSTNVTALHVTVTTTPPAAGVGTANPANGYNVGLLRFGDGIGFFDATQIVGGPQWLAVPSGTTQLGYSVQPGGAISAAEVIGGTPPFGGGGSLAGLSDVALASVADAQVLTYQASSSKWINATPTGGGGGPTTYRVNLAVDTASVRFPTSGSFPTTWVQMRAYYGGRITSSGGGAAGVNIQFSGLTSTNYDSQQVRGTNNTMTVTTSASIAGGKLGDFPNRSSTNTRQQAVGGFLLENPVNAVDIWWPVLHGHMSCYYGGGINQVETEINTTTYKSNVAITSILLYPDSSNFAAGSTFRLDLES